MGPVPKEERSDPGDGKRDDLLMEPGFAVMENDTTDSDEDEEDNNSDQGDFEHQGYQLLSQDPDPLIEDFVGASASVNQVNTGQPEISPQLAHVLPKEIPKPDMSTIVTHTDTPESLKHRRDHMASDDKIKEAMSGISLPIGNAPNWANFVQEKDWKPNLVQTIKKDEKPKDKSDVEKKS